MAVRIGSNSASLQAQRRLAENTDRLTTTFARLSSGQRINSASDDAAALAIAEKLNTDSRIFTQAMRNINDGVSYLNVADGALAELSTITTRQRELAEQAANGVYTPTQRKALNAEANALVQEFNRIVHSTDFNGRKLLDIERSGGKLRVQGGYGVDGSVAFSLGDDLARTVGTGTFNDGVVFQHDGGSTNHDLAVADLDGNGALDLITARYGGAYASLNDGLGNFSTPVLYAAEWKANAVFAADINGDGAPDLITAGDGEGSGRATVRFNNGSGSFGAAISYGIESVPTSVFVTDINGDGAPDLVASGSHRATVRLNDGHGSFGGEVSYTANDVTALFLADVNGDGAADLATAGGTYATVRLNDGNGSFGAAVSYAESFGNIFLADLNGDAAVDLVTAGSGGGGGRASVRLNDGSGSFGAAVSYATESGGSSSVFLTDINGDGAADLITAGAETGKGGAAVATVQINDGSAGFGSAVSLSMNLPGNFGNFGLAVADLNGDGVPDLATAGQEDGPAVFVANAIAHDVTTIPTLCLNTRETARQALTLLEDQQDRISAERGSIGSFQSRLAVALNTLGVSRENSDAAGARITDTDIARESSDLVRNRILQQAGAAVLAQAGMQPSLALQLLRT